MEQNNKLFPENRVKELLKVLISILQKNNILHFGNTYENKKEVLQIVSELEVLGVDFSGIDVGESFLEELIIGFNEAYPSEKIAFPIPESRSTISKLLDINFDIEQRKRILKEIIKDTTIQIDDIDIHDKGIQIKNVGRFDLYDKEICLWSKDCGAPSKQMWQSFISFMAQMSRDKQVVFLTEVMKMNVSLLGDWNFYWSSDRDEETSECAHGISINLGDEFGENLLEIDTAQMNTTDRFSLRCGNN